MTFFKAISDLYSDDTKKVESALISATFVKDIEGLPNYLYCTGFNISGLNVLDNGFDFFYDTFSNRLIYQCSYIHNIPRLMGLKVWLKDQSHYIPVTEANVKTDFLMHFNHSYFLDNNCFDKATILRVRGLNPLYNSEHQVKHFTLAEINDITNRRFGERFTFSPNIERDEANQLQYPYRKHFINYGNLSFDSVRLFYKNCIGKTKGYGDSWLKLGEDELRALDENNPGWSDGLWD